MSKALVSHISDFGELSVSRIGGKAYNLMRLADTGVPVPAFYVISADACRQTIAADAGFDPGANLETNLTKIRGCIRDATLAPDLSDAIRAAHRACFSSGTTVAVRSSSVEEDGSCYSFAGIYESILGVQDEEAVLAAIKRVWMSAVSDRVVAYRRRHGMPLLDVNIAVIVQQMVDASCSGVCFTRDPVSGSCQRVLISSLLGLGEGLVSRGFPADTFYVDRQDFSIQKNLVEKKQQLILDRPAGGVKLSEVGPGNRHAASLSSQQAIQVAKVCLEIESLFGQPQDVEFCFGKNGDLAILQARPVTASDRPGDPVRPSEQLGNHIVWDNSNIIESYSGVTTPMTFSFISRAYSIVYHCFAEVMGISPRVVRQHHDTFNNMLGLFHGRVYYNLKNWYRLVRMFPGYHYNRHFMESMMGVKESTSVEDQQPPVGALRRWFVEFPALLRLLARSTWNFLRIRGIVNRFEQHFYQHYDEWSQIDFDSLPAHETARLYEMMERKMLWNWKAPIINDFYVMVFYGTLRSMCVNWCGDETASLQNGLVCGEGGLRSDEPAKLLVRMTKLVKSNPPLCQLVLHQPVELLPELIADDHRFAEFNELMACYLDQYGLRCADELKLESYSYQDEPHRLYQMIRSFLQAVDSRHGDLDAIEHRERNLRREAEQQANEKLSQQRGWIPRRFLFHWVLRNARLGIRNRENMRFARTRIYGILRRMLRSVGQTFADNDILDDREDIFYLTIDEVWDFVKGTAVTTDLRGLARLRQKEYTTYQQEAAPSPADRFETFGLPYHDNKLDKSAPSASDEESPTLSGTGCCPGVVRGAAQVVDDPNAATSFEGDILVARRTDPGWVAIYPAFSGILVERGSVLSHSAIIAREMGIPTIVGIAGLTQKIRSGQQIQMDGRTGTVRIES